MSSFEGAKNAGNVSTLSAGADRSKGVNVSRLKEREPAAVLTCTDNSGVSHSTNRCQAIKCSKQELFVCEGSTILVHDAV